MPATTLSLDALEEKGWFLSQEGLNSLVEKLGAEKATLEQVIELAKDADLRDLTEKGFRKGDLTKLTQLPSTLVLQVLQIQNIAVPSIQHVEKPRLLRVVFTDGSSKKKWIGAEILGQVESISLHTPPGTKFLVKKPIDIREQLLILGPGMLTCLGGEVQEMIQAWKAGRQFIKRTKGNQTTAQEDLPPPFVPFKIKANQPTREKIKEPKQQQQATLTPGSGNTNSKNNRRSKEKDGKRKDAPPPKSNRKKDDAPTKKEDGSAKKEGGSTKKDASSTKKGGGQAKKDSGSTTKDGTPTTKKDRGSTKKDDGSAKKVPKPTNKQSKSMKTKQSELEKKESKDGGPQDKHSKNKQQRQSPMDSTKQSDTRTKSNQTPTDDTATSTRTSNNKNKNKSRNQPHPPSPGSLTSQQISPVTISTTNELKPTVLSASSKPFIPSSTSFSVQQQQEQTTDASSSSRGRGANRGNRGRGNNRGRGRGRGRGADQ